MFFDHFFKRTKGCICSIQRELLSLQVLIRTGVTQDKERCDRREVGEQRDRVLTEVKYFISANFTKTYVYMNRPLYVGDLSQGLEVPYRWGTWQVSCSSFSINPLHSADEDQRRHSRVETGECLSVEEAELTEQPLLPLPPLHPLPPACAGCPESGNLCQGQRASS